MFNSCGVCISMEFTKTSPYKCAVRSIIKFFTAEKCSPPKFTDIYVLCMEKTMSWPSATQTDGKKCSVTVE